MRKILLMILCLGLIGCVTVTTRLEKYKNQDINTAKIEIDCDIPTAKLIVKKAIKELNLIERPNLEKDNFIFANTGYGNYLKKSFSSLGIIPTNYCRIGLFFDYNSKTKSTIIIITEETISGGSLGLLSSLGASPIRYTLADKIKLKSQLSESN